MSEALKAVRAGREAVADHGSIKEFRSASRAAVAWRAAALETGLDRFAARLKDELGAGAIQILTEQSGAFSAVASSGALPRIDLSQLPGRSDPFWIARGVFAAPFAPDEGPRGALIVAELPEADLEGAAELARATAAAISSQERLRSLEGRRADAEADLVSLRARLENQSVVTEAIIGEREGLREVMDRVARVAGSDVPVLILGETGSGKEVIARAIHERSSHRHGPFVRVNCGAIPTELIDSELFGHERGAFTGATSTRKGWFERANGGTLLLDEAGELTLAAQVRLLRVLQEGTLERVGASQTTQVDVRIIAATHRDLPAMVEAGSFRADLWYRLSVFPLQLPALRERRHDIPLLARHFAKKAGERLGNPSLEPSPRDLELLLAYDWPGNIRELGSVVERAALLGAGLRLETAQALGHPAPAPARREKRPSVYDLEQITVAHIERALDRTRGRIEGPHGAAALLGVNPHTLRSRMKRLGIDWAAFRTPR